VKGLGERSERERVPLVYWSAGALVLSFAGATGGYVSFGRRKEGGADEGRSWGRTY